MPITRSAAKRNINEKVIGGMGDCFDLLGCPEEIIDQIFAYLDPEERTKMSLNKRLHKIVVESKYYLEEAELGQPFSDDFSFTINDRKYPFDFTRRIANNTSIGELTIYGPDSAKITDKFCDVIKEFISMKQLIIHFSNKEKAVEIVTKSFILDLSKRCESLTLMGFNFLTTPEILHNAYESVTDGSVILHHVRMGGIDQETLNGFVTFLGISFRDEQIFSNRKIEAYKDYSDNETTNIVNIFDGFIQIAFVVRGVSIMWKIDIEMHKNQEALNLAKETPQRRGFKRVRMDVYSE